MTDMQRQAIGCLCDTLTRVSVGLEDLRFAFRVADQRSLHLKALVKDCQDALALAKIAEL